MQYTTFLNQLQNDSDEERFTEKDLNVELPFQDNDTHFRKFEIKFRNKESKEDEKKYFWILKKINCF